ncbi:hypothetical protein IDH44_17505 [Paenibacillus sp. IB182496]|uniref:Uncharacterized protein n=1 Tax=Paenibacillus sabuli TaxID=2772509 RepID=A0A927BVA6_9BACL|nr:hypothetical protein [Paenibacillus sabuli]MBD2846997.1 hypothetical protein [Paenibacillus sabuli]
MKKKSVVIGFILLASSLSVSTLVWGNVTPWGKMEKTEGVLSIQENSTIPIPGEKEKNSVINSIDSITGNPTKELDAFVDKGIITIETIQFNDGKENQLLKFYGIETELGRKPISINDEPYILTEVPNQNYSLIEYKGNLYSVDLNRKLISPVLKNEVNNYKKKDLDQLYIEGIVPSWGGDAHVSLDGNYILFHTTRNLIYNQNYNGEMWIKDLSSGSEKKVMDGGYSFIGWAQDKEAIIFRSEKIELVNLVDGSISVLADFALTSGVAFPYLVYQDEYEKVNILNLENNEIRQLEFEPLNQVAFIRTIRNSPWALVLNAPDKMEAARTLEIINLETLEIKHLDEPESQLILDSQWITEDQFMIHTRHLNTGAETSYITNLNEIKGN